MSNVNADTLKSIRLNIIDIIENTIKWKFEDGSHDAEREETYGVSMDLKEFLPEFNHGEGPMYIQQDFEIQVNRTVDGKSDHQSRAFDVICELEENITQENLNTGDLEVSKLVTQREMDYETNEPNSDALIVTAFIKVFFRDLRS